MRAPTKLALSVIALVFSSAVAFPPPLRCCTHPRMPPVRSRSIMTCLAGVGRINLASTVTHATPW